MQRLYAIAWERERGRKYCPRSYPLYDWTDDDVWFYLAQHRVEVPDAYRFMYGLGVQRSRLRISQFFSVDTAHILARISEYYPELMERVLKREPSAYLVSLYWDSEMFRRRSPKRQAMEKQAESAPIDYQARLLAMLGNIPAHFHAETARKVAERYRTFVMTFMKNLKAENYRMLHDALLAGDPKLRTLRGIGVKVGLNAYRDANPGGPEYPGANRVTRAQNQHPAE